MAEEKLQENEKFKLPEDGRMVLRTENLVKKYGKRTVVSHVSINVKQGEIVGLLGPNGAGKTTSFYMTTGLIVPNEGHIYLNDQDITSYPVYKRAQNGIGYLAEVMPRDFAAVEKTGDEVKLYTILIHREDKMALCGFLHKEDRDIFSILTSVSGVGSKMALVLLDEFQSSELIGFVIAGNHKELTRAKGVGPKLAQKIILELKDKLMNYNNTAPIEIKTSNVQNTQAMEDAQTVLISLGYERAEIKDAFSKAMLNLKNNASAEDILKESLKILSV